MAVQNMTTAIVISKLFAINFLGASIADFGLLHSKTYQNIKIAIFTSALISSLVVISLYNSLRMSPLLIAYNKKSLWLYYS